MVSFGFLPLSNNKFVLATVSAVTKRKKMMFMINLANNSNNKNTNNVDLTPHLNDMVLRSWITTRGIG